MEFLQMIQTAITTPNEDLMNFLSIPIIFLDIFVGAYFFTTILNIQYSKKKMLMYLLIHGILSNIVAFIVPTSYTIFVTMIIWPILVFFIFKTTILKSILSEVITLVTTSILELALSGIFLNGFNISYNTLMTVPIYRIPCVFCIYTILILLTLAIKYFKININVFDNMNKRTKILLIINMILMIIVIGTQFYLVRFYSDTMPFFITVLGVVALVAYFSVSIYNIMNVSKLEVTSRDLEGAQLTIRSLRVLHDTVRSFKHDFDNIVNSIGGYIKDDNMTGLEEYYNQLLQDCRKTNNLYSLSPNVINQPAIYNILATKYYIADEQNIQINLDVFLDLNEIEQHMKIYEFTRILGILLDNAIEASKECNEKTINVTFRKEETKHRLLIIIENTYSNKNIDTDKIYEKGYSTKKGNTGLGLWKIREILKKNNNLNLFTTKNNELFKQQFEIYY